MIIKVNKYFVDIILPVYNSENFILKTINSILNQKFKNWRLMIIDDKSSDNTLNIIKKNYSAYIKGKKFFLYQNSENKGQGYSRNFLLKRAKAKYIAFIDSDDLWKKNKLYEQINFMEENKYDFTFTDYNILKENKKINIIKAPNFFNYNSFVRNTFIATSTIILNRKAIGKLNFPNLRICEDYFFKCNLLKKFTAFKLSKVNTYYRIRKDSLQSHRLGVLYEVWKINKNFNNMRLFQNFLSLLFISINSLKKYGLR
jgi:teichuronic acid biosynthesis glycosyltransferase TuaG